jgi:hypothetical protein
MFPNMTSSLTLIQKTAQHFSHYHASCIETQTMKSQKDKDNPYPVSTPLPLPQKNKKTKDTMAPK